MAETGFLLDTNVISEARKPKPHGAVLEWIASVGPNALFVPAMALFEMQARVELTRRQDPAKAKGIEEWVDSLCRLDNILPMDWQCLRLCAKLMDGRSPDLFGEATIAATARIHRLTVATRNTEDYRHFEVQVFNPFTRR